ncbi:MAG: SoxR reducing system RseC family protein [Treponema sp.]|jgi:positive regulator of sigma E activity|nr:SoxR reducing system RseC family protein [Treponema sp.]
MKGRIYNIEGKTVFILPEQVGCFGCMSQKCSRKFQLVATENRTGREVSPGQIVETEIAKNPLMKQMCLSLLPLLVGFTVGFMLTSIFFPLSRDGAKAAAGVAGLCVAGFAVYALRKRFPSNGYPHIIKIL